ncbi:glycerol-3-phosphatase [Jeongeupia sp. HS-3]|uniref:HAD-IA family hydrolase n=1 Tax=Jeongeupia sp. HS-3 TaxID=1009682 RepID=UPI0018A439A9|nr:HAD-IA family hydrolase [Jeongeupia sp. HS-3]BCL75983.1 glycerol-3-phosphatase [Jeongeupia sp. HS-3]
MAASGFPMKPKVYPMPSLNQFDGFLFDMDGTLLDSTPCIEGLWRRWATHTGLDADWVLQHIHGRRGIDTIRLVAPHLDAEATLKMLIAEEQQTLEGTTAIAGARALLEWLAATQQKWGVVTSAPRQLAIAKLAYLDLPQPPVLIGAEDVRHGKPHPAPYVQGIAALGLPASRILAFEDAPAGILSARAAGLAVVALRTSHPDHALGDASWIIDDLLDLQLHASMPQQPEDAAC